MINRIKLLSGTAILALSGALIPSASANTIVAPYYNSTFGQLLGADFGGSGIDNNSVAISKSTSGTVTVGITVTPRYGNPAVTNNGAGVFQAVTGGDVDDAQPGYARWNVDFSVAGLTDGQNWALWYDADPSSVNTVNPFYRDTFGFISPILVYPLNHQDSFNDGFFYLGGLNFNPDANGQYAFGIFAYDVDGSVLAHADILVNAGRGAPKSAPDGGSTLLMVGGVMAGLAFVRRRFRK